tara:strand:- start:918 stop:1808 length:891 start_codon:yes stop_codon:yes gene_type:complete
MSEASKNKKSTAKVEKHDLLYIMSNSCGWCKKSQPVVDELVKEGAKITTLDVQNPADQAKINEVKQKYNAQCGTPFFIDAETGNQVCGFREKDVLQKWVNGEEIPKPPQPKSPPPPPPSPDKIDDETAIKEWKGKYEVWSKENDHLPKIMPADTILTRVKKSYEARQNQQGAPGAPGAPGQLGNAPSDPNVKINSKFYYQFINNKKEMVMADTAYINSLKHQYLQRESDGLLSKVVGDTNFNKPAVQPNKPAVPPKKANVNGKVKEQLSKMKKEQAKNKKEANKKSKKNTKKIAGV